MLRDLLTRRLIHMAIGRRLRPWLATGGGFSSLPYRPLHRAAWKLSWHSSWLGSPSKWSKKREQEGNHNAFYVLIWYITHHHFGHILFLRSEWLGVAHNQGEGNQALFFSRKKNQRIYGHIVKPSRYDRKSLEHFKQEHARFVLHF